MPAASRNRFAGRAMVRRPQDEMASLENDGAFSEMLKGFPLIPELT
jgi:hypothetical protein